MLDTGSIVTTPTGERGTLISPQTGGTFAYYRNTTDLNIAVWAVEMQNGEVKFYRETSLTLVE
jgi:hypothetical protein